MCIIIIIILSEDLDYSVCILFFDGERPSTSPLLHSDSSGHTRFSIVTILIGAEESHSLFFVGVNEDTE